MIKIEHEVFASPEQMLFIIEGMRNPMNSWHRTDSVIGKDFETDTTPSLYLGDNDGELMNTLSKAGSDHRKFMRMMPVYIRVTAPLYWWKEFDTYRIGTVPNSCSTMHKIHDKKFTLDDFSHEHLQAPMVEILKHTIHGLNDARDAYLDSKDKLMWWQMIQLLPSTYNQTRNLMLNYEVLSKIYWARKNHKLDEWRTFCEWIENIPYSWLILNQKTTKNKDYRSWLN